MEARRLLRRCDAVTGNCCMWCDLAIINSSSKTVAAGPAIDADLLSRPTMGVTAPGVPLVGVWPSAVSAPLVELSRLNKPITDLAALGFVRPPKVHTCVCVRASKSIQTHTHTHMEVGSHVFILICWWFVCEHLFGEFCAWHVPIRGCEDAVRKLNTHKHDFLVQLQFF